MWNESARDYFFVSGNEQPDADALFAQRYCSDTTTERIKLHKINALDLRMVLSRIACVAPNLDHSSPEWSTDPKKRLLVCMGRANVHMRKIKDRKDEYRATPVIARPRLGVCGIEGKIYILADRSWRESTTTQLKPYTGFSSDQWGEFPGSDDFITWTEALEPNNINIALSELTPLSRFIQKVARELTASSNRSIEIFAGIRHAQDIPAGSDVIYPGIIRNSIMKTPINNTPRKR